MPTVFLSYSREDLPLIQELEVQLKKHSEISIWLDQARIYGGKKWPKILGEAIADQDVFLLAWSKYSAASHFVEFEWCTAIALRKTIVPCLLDNTALAPSLKTFHGHRVDDVAGLIRSLQAGQPADTHRRKLVIDSLNNVTAMKESAVLQQAKVIFAQQHWSVQGNLYQAGRDFHYHAAPSPSNGQKSAKPLLERWQIWVVIVGGILTAILTALQIQERIWPPQSPEKPSSLSSEDQAGQFEDQPVSGTIFGDGDKRLPGVLVKLPEFNKSVTSDENGRYQFSVKALRGQQVELLAEANDYEPMERFVSLGNEHNDFTMQRLRR